MSRPDAERSLDIYKTFGKQTEQVVQYLSLARQYEMFTRLEVPKLKHAPTTLTASLEEYLNDPDFELNRRQYLAQQEGKRTGKPVSSKPASTPFDRPAVTSAARSQHAQPQPQPQPAQSPPKGPAPDLIDFFESIEQNQQPMAQYDNNPQQQYQSGAPQAQTYQQMPMPQQTGYNPFLQQQPPPQQQQQQPTYQPESLPQPGPLQTDFTGAGFGGYGPQPQQQAPAQQQGFHFQSNLSPIPQNGVADFQSQALATSPQLQIQPQPTSTNPFRQSMMHSGTSQFSPVSAVSTPQSTNPFARHNTGATTSNGPASSIGFDQTFSPTQISPQQPTFPSNSPPALQPQRTGTNPFAKNRPATAGPLTASVTGSTNPFRQSAFVNQETGQGWQHNNQGTFAGFDVNNVGTVPIFPRPGQT
jgi:hypothetical protein